MQKFLIIALTAIFSASFFSCSVNRMATNAVADVLSGAGGTSTVFTGDDDPELVSDALPFALKMYESVLAGAPDHEALLVATGSAFVMYANAFVEANADALPKDQYTQKVEEKARARRLYLRAADYLGRALELRSRGVADALASGDAARAQKSLSRFRKADVPLLYWDSAAIMSAYALDPFDFTLGARLGAVRLMMARAYELDPSFNNGALDDFYIAFYGALPADMGGDQTKAREHFALAVQRSKGLAASPYISLATSIALPKQDYKEFKRLLEQALAVDPQADRGNRLANLLAQKKAKLLLEHSEDLFFDLGEGTGDETAE